MTELDFKIYSTTTSIDEFRVTSLLKVVSSFVNSAQQVRPIVIELFSSSLLPSSFLPFFSSSSSRRWQAHEQRGSLSGASVIKLAQRRMIFPNSSLQMSPFPKLGVILG